MSKPEPVDYQHQADVWNALLNPPGSRDALMELVFDQDLLDQRNEIVRSLNLAIAQDKHGLVLDMRASLKKRDREGDFHRLGLGSEHEYDMDGVYARRDELADGHLEEYDPRGISDLNDLRKEMAEDIVRRSDGAADYGDAYAYVSQYLFSDYELDKQGRAVRMLDIQIPRYKDSSDRGWGPQVVRRYGDLGQAAPEHMLHSERWWEFSTIAVDHGRLDPEVLWVVDSVERGASVTDEDYSRILAIYGVDETSELWADPEGAVRLMVGGYFSDFEARRDWLFDGFLNEGAESFSVRVNAFEARGVEQGVEDLPQFGSYVRRDKILFDYFRSFNWEFDKGVSYNVDKIMADRDFEDRALHPSVKLLPDKWLATWDEDEMRTILRDGLRAMQADVDGLDASDTYSVELEETGTASISSAFEVFKGFYDFFGPEGDTYVGLLENRFQLIQDQTWSKSVSDSKQRTARAKEYLYRVLDVGEKASDELVLEVEAILGRYDNLSDMLADEDTAIQIRGKHEGRKSEGRFSDKGYDLDLVNEAEKAFDLVMRSYLTAVQYADFASGDKDHEYYAMVDSLGDYDGVVSALASDTFKRGVDALVTRNRDAAIERRGLAAEVQTGEEVSLFRNRLSRMFREKGIINVDSDRAFTNHIDNVIIPRLVESAFYGDVPYGTEEQVREIFDSARDPSDTVFGQNLYEMDEEAYRIQFDESRPPGMPFPGARFVEPGEFAPRFDRAAFAQDIDDAYIESPEFATFLSEQMDAASFEEAWQQAALPRARRDRGAELDAADARVASFQSALDRAIASRGDRSHQLNSARENLRLVIAAGGDDSSVRAAEDAVTQAESAMRSGAGGVARAQAALEDAQARAAREKGEVTAEYAPIIGMMKTDQTGRRRMMVPPTAGEGSQFIGRMAPTGKQRPVTSLFTQEGGVWNIDPYQYARERREAYIEPGLTQREFYERELPGLTERYEGSPLFVREQERLERERLADEKSRLDDERIGEGRRRSRLSRRAAMNVFSRRA